MELEQNANFLKIKAGPQAVALPITIGQIEPETPQVSGFATLMEEVSPPLETQDVEAPAINFAQAFPARPDETPIPDIRAPASLLSEVNDPSEVALPPAVILAPPSMENPVHPSQVDAAPLKTEAVESPLLHPSTLPLGAVSVAFPTWQSSAFEPTLDEKVAPITDDRSVKTVEKAVEITTTPIPMPKSNPSVAAVPMAANLAEFFDPLADKKPEPALTEVAKEPVKTESARIVAPQPSATTPVITQASIQAPLIQTEAGIEPDFTITLRTERPALDGGALLSPVSRASAPIQTQLAAQFPTQIAANTQKVIELRLDPPELGRVVIHITTQDQSVNAQIVADRPDTLDLMRRHAEFFTNTLDKAGFSQSNLSFQQGGGQPPPKAMAEFQLDQADSLSEDLPTPTTPARLIEGRLDIRL